MLQHDLKHYETRLIDASNEPRLYAWCICGAWAADTTSLNLSILMKPFFAHLKQVGDARLSTWVGDTHPASALL